MIGDLDDVINVDIKRCYQNHPKVNSENLLNILKTHAFYNPDVGYCQGMNYVVGTLFIQLQDEELAFKSLIGLIEKFNMMSLFNKDLHKLKLFFYQFDRLVGILLPEVHDRFKEEMISSSHFSSSWFMTIFSSILQDKPILNEIWDYFLYKGWKVIFKAGIAVIMRISDFIVQNRFEDVMGLLAMVHHPSSPVQVFDSTFMDRVKRVSIPDSLLRDL